MKTTTRSPKLSVSASGEGLVSRGGVALLVETARVAGFERELRRGLAPWARRRAVHDPARVVAQLAYALALGGDCLADIGMPRDATAIVGPVPSDPTVSRVVDDLAAGGAEVLAVIAAAHGAARARVHACGAGPRPDGTVAVDIDPTIVVAHSAKELAAPTFKKTFGHHPVLAFLDHGEGGTGEALAGLLRGGNANANTAADLIAAMDAALAGLPVSGRAVTFAEPRMSSSASRPTQGRARAGRASAIRVVPSSTTGTTVPAVNPYCDEPQPRRRDVFPAHRYS